MLRSVIRRSFNIRSATATNSFPAVVIRTERVLRSNSLTPRMPSICSQPGSPLAGVRGLDLTRILAGPWATQLLADLGAEIIKIERPTGGDDTRGWGPPYLDEENDDHPLSAYFVSTNRGKKSVAI